MKGGDTVEKEQIAHDLAVAKLCGSDLQVKELCEKYDQYYKEILEYLMSIPAEPSKSTAIKSPMRGR